MSTTYSIPTTAAEVRSTSARLRTAATKASKLEAIHQLCTFAAWKAGTIADMPSDGKAADLADLLGVSAGHVSKAGSVARCAADVIEKAVGGSIADVCADHAHDTSADTLRKVTAAIDAVNAAAKADPTWKSADCVSIDSMYRFLGLGKSGGESTYSAKLRKAAQQAQAENVSESDFIAAARQAWADMRSAS